MFNCCLPLYIFHSSESFHLFSYICILLRFFLLFLFSVCTVKILFAMSCNFYQTLDSIYELYFELFHISILAKFTFFISLEKGAKLEHIKLLSRCENFVLDFVFISFKYSLIMDLVALCCHVFAYYNIVTT